MSCFNIYTTYINYIVSLPDYSQVDLQKRGYGPSYFLWFCSESSNRTEYREQNQTFCFQKTLSSCCFSFSCSAVIKILYRHKRGVRIYLRKWKKSSERDFRMEKCIQKLDTKHETDFFSPFIPPGVQYRSFVQITFL